MWFGKVAIIFYIFSVGALFSLYYVNTIFNDPTITNASTTCTWGLSANQFSPFSCTSYQALSVLAGTYKINQQVNSSLIFGDFIAGLTVLFGLLTGQTIANMITAIPFFDASWTLFANLMFTFSSVCLWIYIVANRST